MSWLTEIAGKAEDLLNKVDKSAATALQNKPKFGSAVDISTRIDQQSIDAYKAAINAVPPRSSSYNSSARAYKYKTYKTSQSASKPKLENDDELLRYLNSAESLEFEVKKMPVKQSLPEKSDSDASGDNSESSEKPAKTVVVLQEDNAATTSQHEDTTDLGDMTQDDEPVSDVKEESPGLLSEEVLKYKNRAEYAESELKRMQKKLEHWNSQISGNDKQVRDLHDQLCDLTAALDAKDSQLAVLKVRLEEADTELKNKRKSIAELKSENERLTKSQEEEFAIHNQMADNLKAKLAQTDAELTKCKEAYTVEQKENLQRISKMEDEQRHLAENVTNLQRKWFEQNERNKSLMSQVQTANRNLESLQQEYNDYKQKAQRILQSKEKLIASLKEGDWDGEKQFTSDNVHALLSAEIEELKQERDLLREELQRANEMTESCRNEIQELEKMAETDANAAREHCRNLEQQLHHERLLKEEMQLLNNQLREEMQFLREDFSRNQNNLQSRIQDRELEIEKLRKQLTAKSLSTVSQDELESRLHALTENLIQKQTIVEALSTEKNSLVLQLERLEQQFKEAQMYGVQNHTVVGVPQSESERKQKPPLFLENPFDSHLTRRVKRVYGSIDAFSIRTAVFFRRYPIARMFIIVYMFLLHLWVMIVLLTYEPEIHNSYKDVNKN